MKHKPGTVAVAKQDIQLAYRVIPKGTVGRICHVGPRLRDAMKSSNNVGVPLKFPKAKSFVGSRGQVVLKRAR